AAPQPDSTFVPPPSEPPPPPESFRAEPEPPSGRRPPFAFLPEQWSWTHAIAVLAGAVGGLLVVLLLWLGGAFPSGRDASTALSPRLAAIEGQLNVLAARPAPASVDPKAINATLDDIAARLARLEGAQAAPRAPVTDPVVLGRLNAAESATKSLADNAAAMSRRADAALRDINSRIDKLAAALADVQTTLRSAAVGSDRASRLAVAASALRNAVEHGDPFIAELAIVKPLAPDAGAIALLEPFAASGVPGNTALGQELVGIIRPMLRAAGEPSRDGGFLDRLQANAEKLVRVRPVDDEARGDDRTAVLARAEQRAAQGNIAAATTELAKLPPDARAPLQAWIAKAEARNKALDASRRLAADAVAALKTAP
ncbi:MAG: hypothetical protein QOF91_1259, partial [Alphaproteobacteria bacterium]|nr:hypothetical protein [Alphaproteobacteria bacterium]